MKRQLLLLSGVLFILLTATNINDLKAQDGFFSDAQTMAQGGATLGIQPIYFTESEDGMLMFRGSYGLSDGLTLHGKLGLLEDNTYAGGHLEIPIASEPASEISFAVLAGVHVWDEPGLKFSGIISKRWDQVSIYSGLSYEPLFLDPETFNPLIVPIGLDVHLNNSPANLVLEADIGANDDGEFYQAITGGVYFYL